MVSVPVIVGAGALAAQGVLHPVGVVLMVAAGGLLADSMWYWAGRWQGHRLVDVACGLTSNPRACVVQVEDRVCRLGALFILPSKFVPGAGNLLAPAAGFARVEPARFAALDGAALLLWATVYTGLGWIFSDHVARAIRWLTEYRTAALLAAAGLVVAAGAWRLLRTRMHARLHEEMLGEAEGEPTA